MRYSPRVLSCWIWSTVRAILRRSEWKLDFLRPAFQGHWKSSEPTPIDPPPMTSYVRSRTVSETNGDFSRKSLFFPTPCSLRPRWRGSPWSWVPALGSKKLEWWGYRIQKDVWRYLQTSGYNTRTCIVKAMKKHAFWHLSDRQTDRHRATAKTALTDIVARQKMTTVTCWNG